jgi:MraZ protein
MLLGTSVGVRLSREGLVVPRELREALEQGFVMTKGLDRCVGVFPEPSWERLSERIDHGTSFLREAARMFQRHVYGGASTGSLGSDGLMKVPDHLRRYAELSDEVVLVGVATRLEIWNPERWAEEESSIEERADEISETLSKYGI